ncbi:hypothetical protein [Brevirhabdus sp.]|uniref:hypothetical protein n=1 Tax=Brevirhabdus sp. TaxID=2004514 RepID=UPI004058C414
MAARSIGETQGFIAKSRKATAGTISGTISRAPSRATAQAGASGAAAAIAGAGAIAAAWLLTAAPAGAQSFDLTLGGRVLGQVSYARDGAGEKISTLLDNTPLGVGDGQYAGSSTPAGAGSIRYLGVSTAPRKSRRIEVIFANARPATVTITPKGEMTDLSDPAAVAAAVPAADPAGQIVDPVAAFGRFVNAADCPGAFRLYDGRRLVQIAPLSRKLTDTALECGFSYKVVAGPGHLSPFYFSNITLSLRYARTKGAAGGGLALQTMEIDTAILGVRLQRRGG